MLLRKSQRSRRATVAFDDRIASSAAPSTNLTSEIARDNPETALKPIAVEPLPEIDNQLPELPEYHLPIETYSKCSESTATGLSELQTFKQLYTQEIVDIIVKATNSYAEKARETANSTHTRS